MIYNKYHLKINFYYIFLYESFLFFFEFILLKKIKIFYYSNMIKNTITEFKLIFYLFSSKKAFVHNIEIRLKKIHVL